MKIKSSPLSLRTTNKDKNIINYCNNSNRFQYYFLVKQYIQLYDDIDIPNEIALLIVNIIIITTFYRTIVVTCTYTLHLVGDTESLYIFNLQSLESILQKYHHHANMINILVYTIRDKEWLNFIDNDDDCYSKSDGWSMLKLGYPITTEEDIYDLLSSRSVNDIIELRYID